MGDKMCQCGHYEYDHGADGSCEFRATSESTEYCPCIIFDDSDPRDAEIARLRAEVERLTEMRRHQVAVEDGLHALVAQQARALAAGPAALRLDARDGLPWGPYKTLPVEDAVATVERAQAVALKGEG
jgi:hypothetical protein